MLLDPAADPGRRVWLPCTNCAATPGLYLLAADGPRVWVQCPTCLHRGWVDTMCGQGRPDYVDDQMAWPA